MRKNDSVTLSTQQQGIVNQWWINAGPKWCFPVFYLYALESHTAGEANLRFEDGGFVDMEFGKPR